MIQLAYQPAYDPFHSVLRVIRLVDAVGQPKLSIEQFRIADFYILFPERMTDVTLPRALRKRLNVALAAAPPRYEAAPVDATVFRKMRQIQDAAVQTLLSKGFLDADSYEVGLLLLNKPSVSEPLLERARFLNTEQEPLMELIRDFVSAVPLGGVNGLKHRTGLGEHRYDAV